MNRIFALDSQTVKRLFQLMALIAFACSSLLANTIFVTSALAGTIGEYTTSGATVNASLISGLDFPLGIVVSGSDLFVTGFSNTIGEYTTSGATVNASLISGLNSPIGLAIAPTTVPEPGTLMLLGIALLGLGAVKQKLFL